MTKFISYFVHIFPLNWDFSACSNRYQDIYINAPILVFFSFKFA